MIMMSMSLWRVWTPGRDWQCITLANKSKLVLVWKHQAETTVILQQRPNSSLAKNLKIETLTEGCCFWIWQMVASYAWFLCYLSWGWNGVTLESHGGLVNRTSHPRSPFMAAKKHINKAGLPLRATPFRRMAVMAFLMSSSFSSAELTCTTSKSTGTQLNLGRRCKTLQPEPVEQQHPEPSFSAFSTYLKTSLTWFSSSGPMPSPGMRVTVCLPPYFAGGGCNIAIGSIITLQCLTLLLKYEVITIRLECNSCFKRQKNFMQVMLRWKYVRSFRVWIHYS